MEQVIGFEELRWLRAFDGNERTTGVPELIGARLLSRGLIERKPSGFTLTARGRIALKKLG